MKTLFFDDWHDKTDNISKILAQKQQNSLQNFAYTSKINW